MLIKSKLKAKITDVTVRDGLQSWRNILKSNDRFNIVKLISELGIKDIEVGSLVSEKVIPQMSNSLEVYKSCKKFNSNLNYHMLVANEKGLQTMNDNNGNFLSFFTSPSDSFNLKNINCSVDESFKNIGKMIKKTQNDTYVKVYLSCINQCPYDGILKDNLIINSIHKLNNKRINEICLSDTLGTLKNSDFKRLVDNIDDSIIPKISIHLHQQFGNDEWKNIVSYCISKNILSFDTSLLNLGGCPAAFSKDTKSGNLNLFDLTNFLDSNDVLHDVEVHKIKDIEDKIKLIIS